MAVIAIDDISYRPLMEDMVWSYSRVNGFSACPYAWFMKYIKHVKEQPRFYSSYGSFIHKILEQYYKGELTEDQLTARFMMGFKNEVQGERPSPAVVEKYIQRGLDYFNTFKRLPYKVLAIEKKVEFEIDGIKFIGYIDLLCEDDEGNLIIVDHKSRDLKPRSKNRKKPTENDQMIDAMLKQLYLYSTGVKNEYGKFPTKLCFNCFKAGTFIEEVFDPEAYNEAIKWTKDSIEEICQTTDFTPNIEFFHCKHICGLGECCCYWDNGKYMWKNKSKPKPPYGKG